MGGIRRGCRNVSPHDGVVVEPLGLLGVRRDIVQTRSGTPAGCAAVHAARTNSDPVRADNALCAACGECHERDSECVRILFLFWTITHIARRLYTKEGKELTEQNAIAVLGAGAVGALAYTFTDTFWFSAVEGEVYALSSMFTALVVWLMLKWEEQADSPHSMRWIVLIAYLMGLSIGVHILNLLTIPALVFIYYFCKYDRITFKGICFVTLIAGAILLVINGIIIPYTVYLGALADVFFVNTLSLSVNSGIVTFVLAMFAALGYWIYATHKRGSTLWNLIAVSITMIMLGFSSYASVTIRAAVNPPMNSNNPDNPSALLSVLNRDQYGNRPLLYGASYAAPIESFTERTFYHFNKSTGKYEQKSTVDDYVYPSQFMHLFPRMWNYLKDERDYKPWAAYRTKLDFARDENGEILRDKSGRPIREEVLDYGRKVAYHDGEQTRTIIEPTFAENLHYFLSYQLNYMYWRYFLWNFVGRQDDIQASDVTITNGNWLSGIRPIDELYLGPQTNLPREMEENPARNTYYFLPFILGIIGLIYQLNRDQRNFTIVMWLFIMMGIALVVYFNSSPGEVRERDYVYAGSFYAFCMWIGLGVLALKDFLQYLAKRDNRAVAIAATAIGLVVPTILCAENWDDHDRLAPLDGARHRLQLSRIDSRERGRQPDNRQLRRQRHVPALVQSGGGRRAHRREGDEFELPRRRMVCGRDEMQG